MFIKEARAREIKNSRGEKTIEVYIETPNGKFIASAPSGKSKGKYETPAWSIRGFDWSIKLANEFLFKIRNKNFQILKFSDFENFERLLKAFENSYEKIGANVSYAIETAFLKAASKDNNKEVWEFIKGNRKIKIPKIMPVGNCIGGGLHSKIEKGEKRPDFQEFLLIPKEDIFKKAFNKNLNAYEHAKKLIKKAEKKWTIDINDENAIKTSLTNEETLEILKQTADKFDLRIGIDLASSSFYRQGYYEYKNKEIMRNALEQEENILFLIEKFDLFYVEDPLQEEDFSGFSSLMKEMKKKKLSAMIVGDDLTVTNFERTKKAVEKNCINAMIIKPNQNGYLMEVARIIEYCKEKKIKIIFSHRSGETMDDALGDYAMGFEADFVKTGILGKERLIKLKRIIDIEGS